MACYTERHLEDKDSNEFLLSNGFINLKSCSKSQWSGHGLYFYLEETDITRNWNQLITTLLKRTYQEGYNHGKSTALTIIYEHFNSLVFPPPEINYNKLTEE